MDQKSRRGNRRRGDRFPDAELLRIPPHSVEAEQAVLGALLLDAQAWDAVADVVTSEDFYRRDHQVIFGGLAGVVETRGPCDAVTVAEFLERKGQLEEAGGLAYIATLARDTPSSANVRVYADIVRERAVLRALVSTGSEIAGSALEASGRTASELVDEAERAVFAIAEKGAKGRAGFQSVKDVLPGTIDRLDALHQNPGKLTGVSTGFSELDRMTAGLQPGDLIIIAGRPSMGKTTLAINIAENAAVGKGVPAAIFSMEMSAEQLSMRMISSLGRVNQGNLRTGMFNDEDWNRINAAVAQMSEAPIFIDETPALTPTEVRARARRLKREKGLGLIVIDYLQLMQVGGGVENRTAEISEISRGLKALAKEMHCPVIALSQLNRSVEQRAEKKPVMSDLRECVVGDTLVELADGSRRPICSLVGLQPEVLAVDPQHRVVRAPAELVWSVGKRPVVRVRLASGREITCTLQHRVLSGTGWMHAGELAVGHRVAVARERPEPSELVDWSDDRIALLGHLVGDGSYLRGQPLRYTSASEENLSRVEQAALSLGSSVRRIRGRGKWSQLVIGGNGNRWHPQGVGAWLKTLGIFGQRSAEKRLPMEVFSLPLDRQAQLLRHLWATDGCIHVRRMGQRGGARVYFATVSEALARDVAALLLRQGIVGRLHSVRQGHHKPVWNVDVSGAQEQCRFLQRVGAFGPRTQAAESLTARLRDVVPNSNVDTLPPAVFEMVRERMRANGISTRSMARLRGTSYGGTSHFRFSPTRSTLASYAKALGDEQLAEYAAEPLFWDRVVGIEPAGEQEVFDLTVPGPASWLADGIVSHNSGAIEQDADVIMMIYREEVYDQNTPRKGIADIIITKQRNGPVGEVQVAFLGEYTKFENLATENWVGGGSDY